ncbi:MAG: FAD-binding oxidoreductase, partial [Chitinophagaceae bacterium]
FRGKRSLKVQSGDLLAIYPKNDHRERLYSIGTIGKEIQLSIKLHEHGLGSGFLAALNEGNSFKARIVKNQHFHFPGKSKSVIMVSNGTGIAPFLGMIATNRRNIPVYLYCGFRKQSSFVQYRESLEKHIEKGSLKQLHLALSREGTHQYVTHLLNRDEEQLADLLSAGGVIMICGSLSMQKDVFELLEQIASRRLFSDLHTLKGKGQIMTDCY